MGADPVGDPAAAGGGGAEPSAATLVAPSCTVARERRPLRGHVLWLAPRRARRAGRGFRFGSCLSRNGRPSRPAPCGAFSPGAPRFHTSRRGWRPTALPGTEVSCGKSNARHRVGHRTRKPPPASPPHPGGKRAGPRCRNLPPREGGFAVIVRGLSPLARMRCTASFARHRVADRGPARFPPGCGGSHGTACPRDRGHCLCRTTPQCPTNLREGEAEPCMKPARCRRIADRVGSHQGTPASARTPFVSAWRSSPITMRASLRQRDNP
ncbi:hypothetical protein QFZ41_000575 [Luteibacter sp. W1I16]